MSDCDKCEQLQRERDEAMAAIRKAHDELRAILKPMATS